MYHSTLGLRVIEEKKKTLPDEKSLNDLSVCPAPPRIRDTTYTGGWGSESGYGYEAGYG